MRSTAILHAMLLGCAACSVTVTSESRAQAQPHPASAPGGTERRAPPPESIAACKERKLGDACTFLSPTGKETGQCVQHEPGSLLGCRPTRN